MRKFITDLLGATVLGLLVSVAVLSQCIPDIQTGSHTIEYVAVEPSVVPELLVDQTVLVQNEDGCGSGVLFTKGDVSFVWTAAHVMRKDPPAAGIAMLGLINPADLPPPVVLKEATVTQRLYRNGEVIGEHKAVAELIAYTAEYDLALLEIKQRSFTKASATFYDESTVPGLGTPVYHVGNYHCDALFSLAEGIISQHLGQKDQTSALIFPGSSGGGVFLKSDGQYIGMVQSFKHPNVSYFCPIRHMREWARSAGVEWAMTRSLPTPADRSGFLKL